MDRGQAILVRSALTYERGTYDLYGSRCTVETTLYAPASAFRNDFARYVIGIRVLDFGCRAGRRALDTAARGAGCLIR